MAYNKKNKARVLFVEDDEELKKLWKYPLREAFSTVFFADDGHKALKKISILAPDVVVSDIMVPGADGFEVCRTIKENPATAHIPVILYSSTYISEDDNQLALQCGASSTMLKDINVEGIIERINVVLTEGQIDTCLEDLCDPEQKIKNREGHISRLRSRLSVLFAELKGQKQELDLNITRFRDFAACMSDYFWETDAENRILFTSSGKKSLLQFPHFGNHGEDFFEFFSQFFDTNEMKSLKQEFQDQQNIETSLSYIEGKNTQRVILMTAQPYHADSGKFNGYRGVFSDITERHNQAERLYHEATHDPLTGLCNKRGLMNSFKEMVANSPGDQHVICYIDLDFFKTVNDTAGHKAGDELLAQISNLIARQVRKSDLTARVGGDEFVILMPRCSLDQAQRLLKSIHEAISQFRFIWESRTYQVGASIGVVSVKDGNTTLEDALHLADKACYSAKNSGGNQIYIQQSQPGLFTEPLVDEEIIEKINYAFAHDTFSLVRQAIALTGKEQTPIAYEILLRLYDGEKQLLPASLMPVIERHNLSARLDEWVCKHVINWILENPEEIADIEFVSINLSGSSLSDPVFRHNLLLSLAVYGSHACKLCFEITESAAIENMSDATTFIEALKKTGCRIALDDFGTGFSSLAYLRNLPIDYIKIDGMFVTNIADDEIDYRMLSSIQQLAELLNIQTIAEYVENDETVKKLEQIGIDMTQGYFIGRPEEIDLGHTVRPQLSRIN